MTAATANTTAPADPRANYRPTPPSPGAGASDADSASGFNALVDLASYSPQTVANLAPPVSAAPARPDPAPLPVPPPSRTPAETTDQDATSNAASNTTGDGGLTNGTGSDATGNAAAPGTHGTGTSSGSGSPTARAAADPRDRDDSDTGSGTAASPLLAVVPPPVAPPIPVSNAATRNGGQSIAGSPPAAKEFSQTLATGAGLAGGTGRTPAGLAGTDGTGDDGPAADGGEVTPNLGTVLGGIQTPGAAGLAASGTLRSAAVGVKSPTSTAASAGSGRSGAVSAANGGTTSLLSGVLDGSPASALAAVGTAGQEAGHGGGQGDASSGGGDPTGSQAGAADGAALVQTNFAPAVDPGTLAAEVAGAAGAAGTSSRTVTSLASQIVQNVDNKVTRFEVALDPEGLGRVNVSVEISAKGEMSARLSFQHADSANALASESVALRQSLADAGFTLKPEDLTFQSGGQTGSQTGSQTGGQGYGASDDSQRPATGGAAAFGAMNRLADLTDLSAMGAASGVATRGLDIRI